MPERNPFQPTSLFERIKAGDVPTSHPDYVPRVRAAHVAHFLRERLEDTLERNKRDPNVDFTRIEEREQLEEIILTGIQLALDQQATELAAFVAGQSEPDGPESAA